MRKLRENGESLEKRYSCDPDDEEPLFVLSPATNPAAYFALQTYADKCEYELSLDIKNLLNKIDEKESRRLGEIGLLNSIYLSKKGEVKPNW